MQEPQQPPLVAGGVHPGRAVGTSQLHPAQRDALTSARRPVKEAQDLKRMLFGQHRQHGEQPGIYQAADNIRLGFGRHCDLGIAQQNVTVVLTVFKIFGESFLVGGCAVWAPRQQLRSITAARMVAERFIRSSYKNEPPARLVQRKVQRNPSLNFNRLSLQQVWFVLPLLDCFDCSRH